MQALRKTLAVVGWLAFTSLFGLYAHYLRICPEDADPPSGHVFPFDNRGHIIYLTLEQHRLFDRILVFAFACLAVSAILQLIERRFRSRD